MTRYDLKVFANELNGITDKKKLNGYTIAEIKKILAQNKYELTTVRVFNGTYNVNYYQFKKIIK